MFHVQGKEYSCAYVVYVMGFQKKMALRFQGALQRSFGGLHAPRWPIIAMTTYTHNMCVHLNISRKKKTRMYTSIMHYIHLAYVITVVHHMDAPGKHMSNCASVHASCCLSCSFLSVHGKQRVLQLTRCSWPSTTSSCHHRWRISSSEVWRMTVVFENYGTIKL